MRDNFVGVKMRRGGVSLAASLLTAAVLSVFAPRVAHADQARLNFLAGKLKDDDARVRTSAALALGASNEDGAVEPLCSSLSDREDVVRQAGAVALKRLNRSKSLDCLKQRANVESNEAAKIAMTRAIEAISSGGEGGGVGGFDSIKENPGAKYYISLSTIANQTGRPQPEIERIVLKSVRTKLDATSNMQRAPLTENADTAREVLKKRAMKGFYLAIAIHPFEYSDGNLKVKVKIGVFNYPSKSLLGEMNKTLTAQGVTNGDRSSEDRLLQLAAEVAIDQFAENAHAF